MVISFMLITKKSVVKNVLIDLRARNIVHAKTYLRHVACTLVTVRGIVKPWIIGYCIIGAVC